MEKIKTFPYMERLHATQRRFVTITSSAKPAGPTNRHRVLCGGLAFLLESVHFLEAT